MVEKLNIFRRRNSETLINNQDIYNSYTSNSIHTEDYRNFVLYLIVGFTGTPVAQPNQINILLDIEFSEDNTIWYRLTDWWYGYLNYTDAQTATRLLESMGYYIQGRYIRLLATVTGGSEGVDYFTVIAKIEFYN